MSNNKASIPFVVEKRGDSERTYDIYSRLLEDRIVFLGSEINEHVANAIIAQLLLLDQKEPNRDIYLYINSPGGSVIDGLAIYDTMQFIRPKVITICVGMAASMAAVLLSGGARRQALPNASVMIHQGRVTFNNTTLTVSDHRISYEESLRLEKRLNLIMSKHTGKTTEQLEKDCKDDKWLSAEDAKEYGLIDQIITKR